MSLDLSQKLSLESVLLYYIRNLDRTFIQWRENLVAANFTLEILEKVVILLTLKKNMTVAMKDFHAQHSNRYFNVHGKSFRMDKFICQCNGSILPCEPSKMK